MIYLFIVFLVFLSLSIFFIQRKMDKYTIGNIWETKKGEIIIITDIDEPSNPFPIKGYCKGNYYEFNIKGVCYKSIDEDISYINILVIKNPILRSIYDCS